LEVLQRFTDIALLDQEFQVARDRGNEGLMVKDLRSPYKPGKRGKGESERLFRIGFPVIGRDCKLKCVKGQKLRSNELLNQRHEYYDLSTRTA